MGARYINLYLQTYFKNFKFVQKNMLRSVEAHVVLIQVGNTLPPIILTIQQ